jgi:hypothetical protein
LGTIPLAWDALYYYFWDVPSEEAPYPWDGGHFEYSFDQQDLTSRVACQGLTTSNATWTKGNSIIKLNFDDNSLAYVQDVQFGPIL